MVARLLAICVSVALTVPTLAAPGGVDLLGTAASSGRALANAVVWLEAGVGRAAEGGRAVLHQRSLKFAPQVLVVRTGTVVDFPNDDRVFHNVFSFRDGKRFDLGIYPVGATRQVVFSEPGVSRLFCNIHPNMAGYVVAVDTPWFASTGAEGRFRIDDVEPGTYTWRAWRAAGPTISGTITVRPGSVLEVAWP